MGRPPSKRRAKVLTFKRLGVIAAVAVSLAVPASAAGQGQDLRNPDRQFPTAPAQTQDLRNPDQQAPATPPAVTQDLRNADRRAPVTVEPIAPPAVTAIEVPADGFDWGDAGIGAAGGIAILAMLAGLTLAGVQHRRGTRVTA
jgi:hypothetical protein